MTRAQSILVAALGGVLAIFLVVPLVALVVTTTDLAAGLASPLVVPALRLSLLTTLASLGIVVVLGIPLAWSLRSARGPVARVVETIVQLPIVVPPAVAGVALLLAFGRRGLVGAWTGSPAFTTLAVVMAEVFVAAPFFVQAALGAFRRVDERLIVVARTFGASPLRVLLRISLPLAAPGLLAGAAMSWARALGEFGATLMFAGNLEGVTQTMPLAIYTAMESDLRAAQAMSIVLVAVAAALFVAMRALLRRAT
ncbi:ABC transporter permease [Sandaracinus amylolyticus]|uniref:Molybdenum transport system permease n=1 Tax=Sandaracinus amylolyticus TaxID=927083 RepID=A0A0F6W9G1_9BACT|nr:ABC transporter permease [Sandaracinus amylolyticus]AKF10850.1 Molybdenum transport system permease protein ModB [Sandaracinus amylolyticus]